MWNLIFYTFNDLKVGSEEIRNLGNKGAPYNMYRINRFDSQYFSMQSLNKYTHFDHKMYQSCESIVNTELSFQRLREKFGNL